MGEARTIEVRLIPRAKRDEIVGTRGGALAVRVTAPPVDGKANDALRKLLAKELAIPRSRIEIVRGAKSRSKVVRIRGAGAASIERLFSG